MAQIEVSNSFLVKMIAICGESFWVNVNGYDRCRRKNAEDFNIDFITKDGLKFIGVEVFHGSDVYFFFTDEKGNEITMAAIRVVHKYERLFDIVATKCLDEIEKHSNNLYREI